MLRRIWVGLRESSVLSSSRLAHGEGDIRFVSLESLDAAFRKVVPDLDGLVVASGTHAEEAP